MKESTIKALVSDALNDPSNVQESASQTVDPAILAETEYRGFGLTLPVPTLRQGEAMKTLLGRYCSDQVAAQRSPVAYQRRIAEVAVLVLNASDDALYRYASETTKEPDWRSAFERLETEAEGESARFTKLAKGYADYVRWVTQRFLAQTALQDEETTPEDQSPSDSSSS